MKIIKAYLLPLFTLLLIAAGAFMPYAAARLQDWQMGISLDSQQFTPVSLTLHQDTIVGPVLQLLGQTNLNWLDYEGATNLSSDKIINITKEYIADLASRGLANNDIKYLDEAQIDIELCLVANENYSAIIWTCSWQDFQDNNYYQVIIDDQSGKVVKHYTASPYLNIEPMNDGLLFISTTNLDGQGDCFIIVNNSSQKVTFVEDNDLVKQVIVEQSVTHNNLTNYDDNNFPLLIKWRAFCEEYYGIEIAEVEKIYAEDFIHYQLKFQQEGREYLLPIEIFVNYTVFN